MPWPPETNQAGQGHLSDYKNNGKKDDHQKDRPFSIKVDPLQGSALGPFLFVLMMDTISMEFRGELPWELLLADDLVVIAERREKLHKYLLTWQKTMAKQGMKVNTDKTEIMVSSKDNREVTIVDSGNVSMK